MILPIPNTLPELTKRLPPTKEPVHPPPTREARDLFDKIKKYGGKAISKYSRKGNGKHSKVTGALKMGLAAVTAKYRWAMWLAVGLVGLIVLLLIYLVWRKRDYKWRRAELEEEACSMFEGNNDDDIDPSTIPFGQPWSHRAMAERRAAAEGA
ncbi:hypothetical protein FSPOR_5080 [Fusarium sporotrichioides]|uniref:Uncharacterized protein n=1 Tax=Fusarium sporotrichioides TaxID=5514 RepID=A0A395S8W6_FUSSP|nr:hypothetical protein FSPOR_5080 [Fusarium sporotrichioides]